MAGGHLFHLSKVNLKTIKMGLKFAMDGCPGKIIAFHLLNAVPFYDLIMKIMKPFSRKELRLLVDTNSIFSSEFILIFFRHSWISITPTSIGSTSMLITFRGHAYQVIMAEIWSRWKYWAKRISLSLNVSATILSWRSRWFLMTTTTPSSAKARAIEEKFIFSIVQGTCESVFNKFNLI